MANVLSEYAAEQFVTDLTQAASGVAGVYNGAKIRPFIADITPEPTTPLSAYTASADANLAAVTITWGAAYRTSKPSIAMDGSTHLWQLADAVNAGPVYGIVVTDSGGTHVLHAERFDSPINLGDTLDGFAYTPQLAFGGPDWGAGAILR